VEQIIIPNKSHFKLNEVCGLTGVKPYVLRFWESEFEEISPVTSASGQRLYEHKDIENVLFIKKFLFIDKKNIEEAKLELKKLRNLQRLENGFIPQIAEEKPISNTHTHADTEENCEMKTDDKIKEIFIDSTHLPIVQSRLTEKELKKLLVAKEKLQQLVQSSGQILN
jgi:DNA-binding transcriptional MerR regulator